MSTTHTEPQTAHSVQFKRYAISAVAIAWTLATADLIFACSYWCIKANVPVARLIQTIASGLLGTRAYQGGASTVWLGVLLQYFMLSLMVLVYYGASMRMKRLIARPLAWGLLYGILLYLLMNDIVLPLSAAARGPKVASWIALSLLVHLIIGVTIALGARWSAICRDRTRISG